MMPTTRAIRARSSTRRRFHAHGQHPLFSLVDIPRRSLLEIPFTPCKTSRVTAEADCGLGLPRSTFRPEQLTGLTPAALYSRRSQVLAVGLLRLLAPLFPVHHCTCWMRQQ